MALFAVKNGIMATGKGIFIQKDVFSTAGSFTYNVPATASHLLVKIWASGGSSGKRHSSGARGGSGGGGGFIKAVVLPGLASSYTVEVGLGGIGSTADKIGGTGGSLTRFKTIAGTSIVDGGSGASGGNGFYDGQGNPKNGGAGGAGGGTSGVLGSNGQASIGGKGATVAASQSGVGNGGAGGAGNLIVGANGNPGSGKIGGSGATNSFATGGGGGGGSGYFGGGQGGQGGADSSGTQGGDGAGAGGSGGSSGVNGSYATLIESIAGSGLLPGNISDADYIAPLAEGALSPTIGTTANNGNSGLIVVEAWVGFPTV